MGVFTRFRDIISANLNVMLEKAEDPEKLLKLMIQEMEDTLVELKASCAGVMASRSKVERAEQQLRTQAERWAGKAQLAIEKGREDLAREALLARRGFEQDAEARAEEAQHLVGLVQQYQDEIRQLEEKLEGARNKRRVLLERHTYASQRKRSQEHIRKADTSDALVRFEQFEQRIDRMEAEGDLVNTARKPSLDEAFAHMEADAELEDELARLKQRVQGHTPQDKTEPTA